MKSDDEFIRQFRLMIWNFWANNFAFIEIGRKGKK